MKLVKITFAVVLATLTSVSFAQSVGGHPGGGGPGGIPSAPPIAACEAVATIDFVNTPDIFLDCPASR